MCAAFRGVIIGEWRKPNITHSMVVLGVHAWFPFSLYIGMSMHGFHSVCGVLSSNLANMNVWPQGIQLLGYHAVYNMAGRGVTTVMSIILYISKFSDKVL